MTIEQVEGNEERTILTAMLVDGVALGRIAAHWEREMFFSRFADIVGTWCVEYHARYGAAPKRNVQGLFEAWASEGQRDKETVTLIDRFLSSLSDEYEGLRRELNSDYVVDLAARHFTRVRLKRTVETVQGFVDGGKLDKAVAHLSSFNRVKLSSDEAIDLLNSKDELQEAFERDAEDIVQFPGALGAFFRGQLTREAFVVFMAPEKRGKTYWLMEMGWQAMKQRRRVAWFAAGDMSRKQMMRRFACRAARWPVKARSWPTTVKYPVRMRRREDGSLQVQHEDRVFNQPLDWHRAWRSFEDTRDFEVRGSDYLRLMAVPNSTLSVKDMDAQLEAWAREGWVADVVIGDYADIYDEDAALPGLSAPRDKINASWKQQRALSQKWHVLYITATQSDADSYDRAVITRRNFSEDKRKLAHATGVLGINQSEEEKAQGLFRLNWVVLRDGANDEGATVGVASALGMGMPFVKSCF